MPADISALYQEAQRCVEKGRYKQARDIGHQLLKARFTGAYEILARSFHGEGKLPIAIQVLESGVQEAPDVWLLWVQLGNYRSEAGDLNGALQAYARAKSCTGAETEQVDLNEALLRLERGNREKGLELLSVVIQQSSDPRIRLVALKHRLGALIEEERIPEALLELGEARLHDADNAELLTTLAFKLMDKKDHTNALNLAKQALGLKRAGEAARVLRLLEGEEAETCSRYEVVLRGRIEDEKVYHFLKRSTVFAESPKEATEFALGFEPPDVRSDFQVESVEMVERDCPGPKGVDWSGELEFL